MRNYAIPKLLFFPFLPKVGTFSSYCSTGSIRRNSILSGFRRLPFQQSRFYANACFVMPKTAMLILANGSEEMEAVITIDVLRRAGVKVTVAGLEGTEPVKCSRDVIIVPDTSFLEEKDNEFDVIILPGGLAGSKSFSSNIHVGKVLKCQEARGCYIAAICAAPIALASHRICEGKSLTSYPSVKSQLEEKYKYIEGKNVVHDGILITSRGPGTAFDFALKIAELLVSAEDTKDVAKAMLYEY